jgi:hypothetical protein
MSTPITRVYDGTESFDRAYTQEELAQHQRQEADRRARAEMEAARESARVSARAKLAAVGLTEEEISALVG